MPRTVIKGKTKSRRKTTRSKTYRSSAHEYAEKVLSGDIIAGKYIIKACERFISDTKRPDLFFDFDFGKKIIALAEHICLWEDQWRGEPVRLALFQKFIILNIFCWKWKRNKQRRFKQVYIQIARKNAKTSLLAIINWIHLILDSSTKTPQILVGANNEEQSKICTNSTAQMALVTPWLSKRIDSKGIRLMIYNEYYHTIGYSVNDRQGLVKAISKKPDTKDGFNPSLGVIDEYHEARDPKILNVIKNGQGSRLEPLLIVITTAGFNKEGPCYSVLRKTNIDVLNGAVDLDTHFGLIYELDSDSEWSKPDCWIKANPMMNDIPAIRENLKDFYKTAKAEGGTSEVDFKTKNLNMWTDSADVWIQQHIWDKNTYGFKVEDLSNKLCYGGLDLAKGIDLNCLSLVFPRAWHVEGKDITAILPFFWLPENKVKANKDGVDYTRWKQQGHIFTTPGDVIDHIQMAKDIIKLCSEFDLHSIAYDPKYMYGGLFQTITSESEIEVNSLAQNSNVLSYPTREFERLATNGNFEHFKNPVLNWNLSNVITFHDRNDNIRIHKGDSQGKVDGVASTINAIAQWMTLESESKESDFWIY